MKFAWPIAKSKDGEDTYVERDEGATIRWRIHLSAPPAAVYECIATDASRARFWAESAVESDGLIHWVFPNEITGQSKVIERNPPRMFSLDYFGGSRAVFELADDGTGGTDLTLIDSGVPPDDRVETVAGWVSVLLELKAAVDYSVDLRNHDRRRTWDEGSVDN